MIDLGKKNVVGVLVNAIDYEATIDQIVIASHERKNLTCTALAVHGVMTGVFDAEYRYQLNQLDLVVPDGQPVQWVLNLLHRARIPERVYGPTLMLRICKRAAREGLSIFLYGSTSNVLDALSKNLSSQFPELTIAGQQASHFRRISASEKRDIAEHIRNSAADIIFIGLGCPRQEVWLYEHRDILAMPMIAVGAAFDFHAGTLPQAPPSLQRVGLEWLFRWVQEPRRLWKRYLLLNPAYVALVVLQATRLLDFDPTRTTPPTQELRPG